MRYCRGIIVYMPCICRALIARCHLNFIKALIADMYELKMYVFINFELNLIVNMQLRIWIKHMRLRV